MTEDYRYLGWQKQRAGLRQTYFKEGLLQWRFDYFIKKAGSRAPHNVTNIATLRALPFLFSDRFCEPLTIFIFFWTLCLKNRPKNILLNWFIIFSSVHFYPSFSKTFDLSLLCVFY